MGLYSGGTAYCLLYYAGDEWYCTVYAIKSYSGGYNFSAYCTNNVYGWQFGASNLGKSVAMKDSAGHVQYYNYWSIVSGCK